MAVKEYFSTLSEDDQNEVTAIVDGIINDISTENEATGEKVVNLPKLMSILEKLNEEKKSAKEVAAVSEKAEKEAAKKAAELNGAEIAKTLDAGDIITFTMGSGKLKQTYSLPIIKKTDKSYTVEFDGSDDAHTTPNKGTGKRYIKFGAVVSFVKKDAASANTASASTANAVVA